MSVIIRLQNLPWSANSYDIRQYFQGLSIPEGGVHIVGGELGDAFIAFSTDEDARQAMMRSGGKLKEVQVSLMLSSRTEMQRVIEAARSAPPAVTVPPQQPPPAAVPQQRTVKINSSESRELRKRSRSRSRDKQHQRFDRRDNSRRKRSRSRDRRDDRRRRRSRSRSSGRDRYGRDIEKREVFPRDKSKDRNERSRDKHTEQARSSPKESHKKQVQQQQTPLPIPVPPPTPIVPSIPPANPISNPFGLPTNLPFLDDRLTAAMKSTLSALNLPIPAKLEKPNAPTTATDTSRDNIPQIPPMPQFLMGDRPNIDVSRSHIGFPDPGPAFGPRPDIPLAFRANFPQWGISQQNENMNIPWVPKPNMPYIPPNLQDNTAFGRNEHPGNRQGFQNLNNMNGIPPSGPALMDDDFRQRFLDQGRFDQRNNNSQNDSDFGNPSRFSNNNKDPPREPFQNRYENDQYPLVRRNFERPEINEQHRPDRFRDNQDSDGRFDYNHQPRGGFERNNFPQKPRDTNNDDDDDDGYGEIINCPPVPYKEIRRSFSIAGYPVLDIRFVFENGMKKVFVKFANSDAKMKAMRAARKIRVGFNVVTIAHVPGERYHAEQQSRDDFENSNDRPRWNDNDDSRGFRRNRGGSYDNNKYDNNDEPEYVPMYNKNEDNRNDKRDNDVIIEPENGINTTKSKMDCLFVTNLPHGTTDRDVFDFFSDIGITPKKLHLMLGSDGEPSGEAYVEFWHIEEALRACKKNGSPMGRSTVNVKLVEHSVMLDAVGLEPEPNSSQEPSKKSEPASLLPNLPRPNAPQRLMDGPIAKPPFLQRIPPNNQAVFPPDSRFKANRNCPPSPERVVVLNNIPYRAEVQEIVEFLGTEFEITVDDIFRKLNDRGQPTSEARVVMPTVEDAMRAIDTLNSLPIRGRPIIMKQLASNISS